MKITKIQILNFLGLSVFKADKLGKLNRLIGNNGAGKSSVLKAIKEAFKSSGIDPELIRTNSDKAEIMIEIDQNMLVERTITTSSNNVKVTIDGDPVNSPQKFLNSLLGLGSNFNPIDFFSPKPPKGMTPERYRRELLLSATPFRVDEKKITSLLEDLGFASNGSWSDVNFEKHGLEVLAQMQKLIYDRRHEVGIDVTRQKKSIEQDKLELPETLNADEFKGFDLSKAIEILSQHKAAIEAHERDIQMRDHLREEAQSVMDDIEKLEKQLASAKSKLEEIKSKGKVLKEKIESFRAPETEKLEKQIADYQLNQKLAHRLEDIERRQNMLKESQAEYESLDRLHNVLVNEAPKRLLAECKMPIKDIEMDGERILIGGVSLDKLSDSEQIKVALNIARALTGDLKVICIDGFEAMDAKSRQAFEAEARSDEYEYFYTIVNQDPKADGSLKLEAEDNGNGAVSKPALNSESQKDNSVALGF